MRMRVVCISRTLGGGGQAFGKLVAEGLGYRYVDEAVLALASHKAQINPGLVADAEHRRSLLDRVLGAMTSSTAFERPTLEAPASGMAYYGRGESMAAPPVPALRAVIRETIAELAVQGEAVIVAHAASMALAGVEGVLRVLVTASEPTRVQRRLAGRHAADEREAAKAVKQSDRERSNYLRDFYGVTEERPTHYDLVMNTDTLSAEQAAGILIAAAEGR